MRMMTKFMAILLICSMAGCATVQLSPEDREYQRHLVWQAWLQCRDVYARSVGGHWMQTFTYSRGVRSGDVRPPIPEMHSELATNVCYKYVPDWNWPPKEKKDESDND